MNYFLLSLLGPRYSSPTGISTTGAGGGGGTLGDHPRIWVDGTMLAFLQLQRTNNTLAWQRLKASADQAVTNGTYASGDETRLADVALAYLIEPAGATKTGYGTQVGVVLDGYCTSGNLDALKGDSGYPYRFYVPLAACGLDWGYDALTTGQRETAATWLMDAADWVWPDCNSSRTGAWAVNSPENNYYAGFCSTVLAAIAADGSDAGTTAVSPGSGSDRPAFHRALFQTKWSDDIAPLLAAGRGSGDPLSSGGAKGGVFGEGTAYGLGSPSEYASYRMACRLLGISLDATSYFADAARSTMHITMPGLASYTPLGDQPSVSNPLVSRTLRHLALLSEDEMAADATLTAQVQYFVETIGQAPTAASVVMPLVTEILHYDPSVSAASDLSGLPLGFFSEGAGFFVWRSSWTSASALAVSLESGTNESHHQGGWNGVRIWKDGWITCDANIYSASGIVQATQYFNSMLGTADGYGQRNQRLLSGDGGVIVGTPSVASDLVYARGQAATAYGWSNTYTGGDANKYRNIPNFLRTVVVLPNKETVVVVDQVTATNSADYKTFMWNCKNTPTRTGQTFKLSNPTASYHAYGEILLPASGITTAVVSQAPDGGGTTSYAISVTGSTGTAAEVFVTTMQISSAGAAPYTVSASSDGTDITCNVDDLAVTIPLDGTSAITVA